MSRNDYDKRRKWVESALEKLFEKKLKVENEIEELNKKMNTPMCGCCKKYFDEDYTNKNGDKFKCCVRCRLKKNKVSFK